jgi:hypothetical protein
MCNNGTLEGAISKHYLARLSSSVIEVQIVIHGEAYSTEYLMG